MRGFVAIASGMLGFTLSQSAQACEIVRLLSGLGQAAEVTNHWDGDTYTTYLVRNEERDAQGVLNNWIKFELIPQRWGFDLELPNGKRFAQVNTLDHEWVVPASQGYGDECAFYSFTITKGANGSAEVWDRRTKIGSIQRFPFHELTN